MSCNDEHMSNSPYPDNLKFIRNGNLKQVNYCTFKYKLYQKQI